MVFCNYTFTRAPKQNFFLIMRTHKLKSLKKLTNSSVLTIRHFWDEKQRVIPWKYCNEKSVTIFKCLINFLFPICWRKKIPLFFFCFALFNFAAVKIQKFEFKF